MKKSAKLDLAGAQETLNWPGERDLESSGSAYQWSWTDSAVGEADGTVIIREDEGIGQGVTDEWGRGWQHGDRHSRDGMPGILGEMFHVPTASAGVHPGLAKLTRSVTDGTL